MMALEPASVLWSSANPGKSVGASRGNRRCSRMAEARRLDHPCLPPPHWLTLRACLFLPPDNPGKGQVPLMLGGTNRHLPGLSWREVCLPTACTGCGIAFSNPKPVPLPLGRALFVVNAGLCFEQLATRGAAWMHDS